MKNLDMAFIRDIKNLIKKARYNVVRTINYEMLKTYYEIGKKIVEEEQRGGQRAEYGKRLLETLSEELSKEFGREYSATALRNMRIFYALYKDNIHQPVTDELYNIKPEDRETAEYEKWGMHV